MNCPVLNKTASLILDIKTVNSDSDPAARIKKGEKELFLAFRKHEKYCRSNRRSKRYSIYVKGILE